MRASPPVVPQLQSCSSPRRPNGSFTDTLPPALAAGSPRVLTYFVELDNRKGRTAGLSNGAQILAGEAPAAVDGLAAAMRRDGVSAAMGAGAACGTTRCSTPGAQAGFTACNHNFKVLERVRSLRAHEPPERTLLVEPGPHLDQRSGQQHPASAKPMSIARSAWRE